jgi:hypothetical protein
LHSGKGASGAANSNSGGSAGAGGGTGTSAADGSGTGTFDPGDKSEMDVSMGPMVEVDAGGNDGTSDGKADAEVAKGQFMELLGRYGTGRGVAATLSLLDATAWWRLVRRHNKVYAQGSLGIRLRRTSLDMAFARVNDGVGVGIGSSVGGGVDVGGEANTARASMNTEPERRRRQQLRLAQLRASACAAVHCCAVYGYPMQQGKKHETHRNLNLN